MIVSVTDSDGPIPMDIGGVFHIGGGLGATGYLMVPTWGYTPDVLGNYTFTESTAGSDVGPAVPAGTTGASPLLRGPH